MSEKESEARFDPARHFSWRDIFVVAAFLIALGVAQAQIHVNSNRLDRIESYGSPQLTELKTLVVTLTARLDKEDEATKHRVESLEIRVNKAIENSEAVHGDQNAHLHAVDARLDRNELQLRATVSDTMQALNERLVGLTARLADIETSNRQTARDVITTVADRVNAIDKRLAVIEQQVVEIHKRTDGAQQQQELMLRDLTKELTNGLQKNGK